ncbi:MAG: hypothetical protein ACRDZ8_11025 [Acidimicrobiales bacterium]
MTAELLLAPRLRPGDRVRFVSPASPDREGVERGAEIVVGWGLRVEIAPHAFNRLGHHLAGCDDDRLGGGGIPTDRGW